MTPHSKFLFIIPAALALVSCSHNISRIHTLALPTPNPTMYSFPLPVDEVHARALDAFSIHNQGRAPVFGPRSTDGHLEQIFSAESATNAVFGAKVLTKPENTNDIFLHTFSRPIDVSPVYRGKNGGLPFIAAFHLHLASDGPDTAVTVTALDTEVVNGTKFGWGPCGHGQGWNCEKVKPTTIEEYSILRYLGGYLGVTNMAPVILPTE